MLYCINLMGNHLFKEMTRIFIPLPWTTLLNKVTYQVETNLSVKTMETAI
jgi:hypothetical protein